MARRTQSAAASKTGAKKDRAADALQMLKQDHDKVAELFNRFTEGSSTDKQQVASEIFKELEIHGTLEEEIFYPALQNQGDPDELAALEHGDEELNGEEILGIDESEDEEDDEDGEAASDMDEDVIASAYEDHQAVKELIHRLKGLDSGSSDFQQGMSELREMVIDHVAEEEDVLFAEAKLKLDINKLGVQMQERKQELMSPTAG
jgi:hemerythrin superfamily protein